MPCTPAYHQAQEGGGILCEAYACVLFEAATLRQRLRLPSETEMDTPQRLTGAFF